MLTALESELAETTARPAVRLSITSPRCLLVGCGEPIAYEIHAWDYQKTRAAMGFQWSGGRRRRFGEPRIYACVRHAEDAQLNAALRHPRWQALMFQKGGLL